MNRYETILEYTLGEFQRKTGCLVEDASDTAIKFQIVASELARLFDRLDHASRQIFPDTAEGEALARHGALRGVTPKLAAKAAGRVTLRAKTPATADILIPAGTLLTSSKNSLVFQTTANITLKKNASAVSAEVESVEAGAHTNLAPGYLDVLMTPVAGIASVENPDKLTGGADEEPEESFRRRVIEAYTQISNGANLHYYEQLAKSEPGVWYARAALAPGVANQIDLYAENFTRTLSDGELAALQEKLETTRELNLRLAVQRPAPKLIDATVKLRVDNGANADLVCLAAYDALYNAILELGPGERFSPGSMSAKLLQVEGVRDVSFSAPAAPVETAAGEIATPGTLNVDLG